MIVDSQPKGSTANIQAFEYFPTLVYIDEHPEWVGYLLQHTEQYYRNSKEQFVERHGDGHCSVLQTGNMLHDDNLKFLSDYILMSSFEILKSQGYRTDIYDFYVSAMWGHDIGQYGGHIPHLHQNTQISGFVFLQSPENGSYPIINDPRVRKEPVQLFEENMFDLTNASSRVHFQKVKPGTVMFTNSWVLHEFSISQTQEQMKFIHFTVSAKEKI